MLALAAWIVSAPLSADEDCGGVEQGVVLDLSAIWEQARGVPDLSGLSTEALHARAEEIERRAIAIAPYVLPYIAEMDLRAGQNVGLLLQLGDHAARQSPYNFDRDNPFAAWQPPDWEDIPVEQARVFRALTAELVEQMREDLRSGRVSSPLDAGDLSSETTVEGVTAILRMNQALLDAGIPIDFEGHSPVDVEDIRDLQAIGRGEYPETGRGSAASHALVAATAHLGDDQVEALFENYRAGRAPEGAEGLGVPAADAKATLDALDALARERQAIAEALRKRGEDPAQTAVLDAIQQELQDLDALIARAGFEVQKRLWGFPETWEVVRGLDGEERLEKLPEERYRDSPVIGQGSRGLERVPLGGTEGEILWTNTVGGGELAWTAEELDMLVRVKDAQELLEGNRSSLGIADVPMPPSLAEKLGLTPRTSANPLLQTPMLDLGPFGPQSSPDQRIDRIALYPVEGRYDYANWVRGQLFRNTLRAQGDTWVNRQLDDTWLNRTVEVLDVFNYPFKGDDPMNWIGPRTELMKWRSEHFSGNAEGALDQAFEHLLDREFRPAMEQMREAQGQIELHQHYNGIYDDKVAQTQTDTMIFVAALPLSAFGVAEGAIGMSRHLAKMRHLRHSSRLVNKSGTLLTRVRYADDAAGIADDFVRVDAKGLVHRPTPIEDDFVRAWRAKYAGSEVNEAVIRQHFRNGFRFDDAGRLTKLSGDDYFRLRQREVRALRDSDLFRQDLRARGISEERIAWMESKESPLSFESPQQYEAFKEDLAGTLREAGLDDSTVTLKGTSTTFYSENPGKPLGHHFDANPAELADIDLGLTSQRMVDGMAAAGHTPHPKIPTIFKTRHTVAEYPELAEFAAKWEGILGREVNFVGLTDSALPKVDPSDFVLIGRVAK